MKRYLSLLIVALLTFISNVKAQMPLMKSVTDKVNALKQSGVDTIITYHPYCIGCILTGISDSSKCFHNFRQYIIWKKDGEGYIQLFDECYTYLFQKPTNALINLLSKNVGEMVQEIILPVEFEKLHNGKLERFTSWIDHSDHLDLIFYIDGEIINKPVDGYHLDTRWEDDYLRSPADANTTPPAGKAVNLNYDKNQHTYLKKLIDLLGLEITRMNFTKAP